MAGFSGIIGHESIIGHMKKSIAADKVTHAYILHGEDKSGKMMLAEAFAAALQCDTEGPEPCLQCHSCKQAISRNHPDIIYIQHNKPNTISVEDIRQQLNNTAAVRPYAGKYKIYIVDEAEKMNVQAQNALLKTIEEPPEYAVILLLTTNAEAFLPTILSRCMMLRLQAVSDDKMISFLMKQYQIPDYQAEICAAFAQGNVGKAIDLANSKDFNGLKDDMLETVKRVRDLEVYELAEAVKRISVFKLEINDYFDLMMIWYRDVLLFKATADVNRLIFKDEVYEIKSQASKSSYEGIELILDALQKAKARIRANVNFELVVELLLLTIKEN